MDASNLTKKQLLFAHYYMAGDNATQAAIKAGYSKKTARSQGHRLLTNVDIKKLIAEKQTRTLSELNVTREQIVQELVHIGSASMGNFIVHDESGNVRIDLSAASKEELSGIAHLVIRQSTCPTCHAEKGSVAYSIRLHDSVRALGMLLEWIGTHDKISFAESIERNLEPEAIEAITTILKKYA